MNGNLIRYYKNGQVKRKEIYKDGEFISGNCYTFEGKDTTFFIYEVNAIFPGGLSAYNNYLASHINYPQKAKDRNIQGVVYVKYMINTKGELIHVTITKSAHPLLDAEAMKAIKSMPN